MPDDHKPLGELAEEWTCKNCSHTAWQYAYIAPRGEMSCDDQDTAGRYGLDPTQFASADEIELCGYCGGSRWQKPKCVAA